MNLPLWPNLATAGVAAVTPQRTAPQESSISKLAYVFLMGFVFLASSRVLEFTLPSLHLPIIVAIAAACLTFISHGVLGAFSTTVGKLLGLFVVWFVVCIPFSEWRGGSFNVLVNDISRSLMVFIMVATTINTVKRLQGLMAISGSGIVIAMAIALAQNSRIDGRLSMSLGQYSNPNDLAQIMLLGMCFLPALGIWRKSQPLRWFGYAMIVPFLYTIFMTGSRSALLTAAILAGVVFLFASPAKKILLAVLIPVLGIGLLASSATARLRIRTLLNTEMSTDLASVANKSEELAVTSASARLLTLQQSFLLTLQHPVFGVGPGVFQAAAADMRGSQGQRALWVETHNSYTQVSSETGIPGAIIFCSAVLACLRGLMDVRRRASQNPRFQHVHSTVDFLLLGFLTFTLTSMFSSVAYSFTFWMLIGLCAAAIAVMNQEMGTSATARRSAMAVRLVAGSTNGDSRPAWRVTLSGKMKPTRPAPGPNQFRG